MGEETKQVMRERCALMLQSAFRGKKGRANLGVVAAPQKSEAEMKANSFKKKFVDLMNNPQRQLVAPAPVPPIAANTAASSGASPAPVMTAASSAVVPAVTPGARAGAGPGIQPNGTQPTDSQADETAKVRNVFRERAAQRAAAKAGKQ